MPDQFRNLRERIKGFLEAAAMVHKGNIVFASLLLNGVDQLTAAAKAMETGTYPLSNAQEASFALDLLFRHTSLNEIRVLLVPERGQNSLLVQSFFATFLSKLLTVDFTKRVHVQVAFVARDIIRFAILTRGFQLAKEVALTGAKVEIWEMEEENQKVCIEQILFSRDSQPFYVLMAHGVADNKDTRFVLSADAERLNSAVKDSEASSIGAVCLKVMKV